MLMLITLSISGFAQNSLTVADGTSTNSYVPVYGLYVDDFVRCQTIYPAAMLDAAAVGYGMNGGTISSLTYYLGTPASDSWGSASFVVKIKEVTATTLSAFVDMTDATTVYTGSLDATQSTMTITFTTPYTYQGGNLLVEIYNTLEGTYKSAYFYGVASTGASWQGYNSTSWSAVTGSAQNFIPKTTFSFTGGTEISCSPVNNLAIDATQITSSSMTLTWTDAVNVGATYTVYDMSDNSVIQSGITGNTYTVTGLNASTDYTFGVEANCSATDASAIATASGRTACSAMNLPWTCGFETNEIESTTAATALPWCAQRYVSPEATSGLTYPYSYTTYPHNGSRALYFYGTTSTSYPAVMALILPEVDVTAYPMNGNRISFWARSSSTSYDKTVYVGTVTNPADINTFTVLDSVLVTGTTHTKYVVSLANASATAPYVVLAVMRGSGNLYLDDMTLEVLPSCLEVASASASNVTSNSVTLSWVPDNSNPSATFTIYNMADNSVVASNLTDTTYTINNLTSNTQYTFGIQANCPAGDASITTVSCRTDCDVESMPFVESFSATLASDPCWTGATGVTAAEVFGGASLPLGNISAGYWNYSTSQNGFTDGHYYNNIYGSSRKAWMITPAIDLTTATSAQLSFDMALTAYSGTMAAPATYTGGQKFMVIVSADGGNTWLANNATVWMNADSNATYAFEDIPYDHYGNYTINLNQYIGNTIKIAFYGESTVSGGDNNFHIDNIAVTEVPSCPNVMGLTLDSQTATSATISWNDNGASDYEVEVSQNGTPLTTVSVVVTDTTAVISGLDIDNDYQVAVRSICGSDYGQWTNPMNIHIGYCLPTPLSVDNDGITSVSFGGMTNTTHPSTAAYANYSTMSGTVPTGLPATVEITYATGYTYGTIIWVDWNNSLSFDSDEVVYVGESTNANPTTLVATFDVPATIAPGSYRMRIVGADMAFDSYTTSIADAANANPCTSYSYGVAEDYTLVVSAAPSCLPVTGLTVTDATSNSVTISWTGTAASYDVYNGTTFVANVTTNSYTFTGLGASSDYTFGVQAICSATDSAAMVTVNASTSCGAITTYPYVQDFASAPNCWMTLDADGDGQTWILYQGAIQSASYNSTALFPDNWLISPQFAIPATGNYEVTWTATAQDQSWPAEHYGVYISTTGNVDTADYTLIQEWTLATGLFNPVIDLSSYAGQNIYIALRHFNCTDQFRISIDDFTVREQAGANQVTINVGQNNPAYGTVTGGGIYTIGDNVTVTATPATGYNFSKWVDDANTTLSTDNPYTFVAATDLSLTAIFLDNAGATYTITVQVNDSTMGTATGSGTYTAGEQVTLVATPFAGYQFVNWTQISGFGTNVVGTDSLLTITVTSDKTFMANFEVGSTPPPTPCDVPTGLHATDVQNESIAIAWDANADVTSWNIQYGPQGGTTTTVSSTTNSYVINGLTGLTTYEIKIQAVCGDGQTSEWSASIVETTTNVGIEEYLLSKISLYPNPANEYVDIQISDNAVNVTMMEVYDVYGKLINTVEVVNNPTRINVSGLANGMYFVRVTTDNGVATKSFVKK